MDLGCGPGDVTRLVRRKRPFVTGIDLSSAMIKQARQADPGGNYEVHDMSALDRNSSLYLRYVKELTDQEDRIQALRAEIVKLRASAGSERASLNAYLDTLTLGG